MIKHYIGEMYFLRAYQYFNKLVSLGDFPIVTEVLPDETEVLKEESKRQPRNKVARFIIEDLDRAIELMSLTTDNGKNRLTKNVALLFKSRVALFEATWLKYHKGTHCISSAASDVYKRQVQTVCRVVRDGREHSKNIMLAFLLI